MIEYTFFKKPIDKPKGCVIGIPGRGNTINDLLTPLMDSGVGDELCIAIVQTEGRVWYPLPNGLEDQHEALEGMKQSRIVLDNEISKIEKYLDIERKNITLVGFSAGAVMALQTAIYSERHFKCVISLSGAILNSLSLQHCNDEIKNTKFLLQHNQQDNCFSWDERYLPMKKALKNKGYNIDTAESVYGVHTITEREAILIGEYLAREYKLEDWSHRALSKYPSRLPLLNQGPS